MQVIDSDPISSDDLVDNIFIDKSLAVSSTFTTLETFNGGFRNAMLELSFRVQCTPDSSGDYCSTTSMIIHRCKTTPK